MVPNETRVIALAARPYGLLGLGTASQTSRTARHIEATVCSPDERLYWAAAHCDRQFRIDPAWRSRPAPQWSDPAYLGGGRFSKGFLALNLATYKFHLQYYRILPLNLLFGSTRFGVLPAFYQYMLYFHPNPRLIRFQYSSSVWPEKSFFLWPLHWWLIQFSL